MSVQNYVDQIRHAVYGKDVRESIAAAIETCYDDAIQTDPSSSIMEVAQARGGYSSLNARENAQDTAIASGISALSASLERETVTRSEQVDALESTDASLAADIAALKGMYGAPLVAETAAEMTDTNRIYVYIGDEVDYTNGDWYYYDGEDWASGGVYNAEAIATDTTLSVTGMAADSKITGDTIAALKALSPVFRKSIKYNDDLDDFTTSGQYYLTADQLAIGTPANWPSSTVGRLIVFGDATDSPTLRGQMVIDTLNNVYIRAGRSSGFNDWATFGGMFYAGIVSASGDFADLDTFPVNSVASVSTASRDNFAHYPGDFRTGALIVTTNSSSSYTGAVQIAYFFIGGLTAQRKYLDGAWKPWVYDGVRTDTYRCETTSGDGVNFVNLAWGLRYMMQNFSWWNEHDRLVIEVGEGTFSLNSAINYITGSTLDSRGLFLPPYCTIVGKGKDKTKLTLYSDSTNDNIMTLLSGLNMPYESTLKDLTLSVKNVRYAIHSDNGITDMPDVTVDNTTLRNNNQVTLENVRLEHLGFDSGYSPTYFAPACWGGGSFNNSNRKFVNCEFIAKQYTAWLNHNRTGLTLPSKFEFENCRFINESGDSFGVNSSYSSINLITWGAKLRNPVTFKNCYANRFLALMPSTTNGAADSACDYNVYADNDMTVAESQTNNAHLADNYITGNCGVAYAEASITAYTPVSSTMGGGVHAYSASDPISGIALNSAAAGEAVTWQRKGLIYLGIIGATGFSAGQTIGYSGGSWAVDTTNPIIKVINANIGRIIEK